jgi:hypothetical protein
VAIEQIRAGVRLRAFGIVADRDIDTAEVPEAKARELFFAIAPQSTLDLRAALLLDS